MKRSERHLSLLAAGLAIGLALSAQPAGQAPAPGYTITTIADASTGPYAGFNSLPSINADGTVAFTDSTGNYLFTGDGGPLQVLYDGTSGPFAGGGFGGHPAISDNGSVAFIANHPSLGGGVFVGDGGAPISIHLGGGFANVDINASGQVGLSTTIGGVRGVFVGNGGALTTIADDSGPLFAFDDVTINDSGQVAFHATLDAGGATILRGDSGSLTTIADSTGPLTFAGSHHQASISDDGTVAFIADLDAGGVGVFTGDGGPITTIATTASPGFNSFDDQGPAINGLGLVLFNSAPGGLHIGPNPIGIGAFHVGSKGFNDAGQIAFSMVVGGKLSIFRADPIIAVTIDVIPGKDPNIIKLFSRFVSVAILTTATFDAATVDPATILLASASVTMRGNGATASQLKDVDKDGDKDLIVKVFTEETTITDGDVMVTLTGTTFSGTMIQGTDTIQVVP